MLHNLQTIQAANSRPLLHLVDPDPDGPASASIQGFAQLKGSILRIERGAVIVAQGDPADYCYVIVAGCVRTVGLMQDGRRQIGEFLVPGDLFGWEALDEYGFGAEAVTRATLRRYTLRSLENFARQDGPPSSTSSKPRTGASPRVSGLLRRARFANAKSTCFSSDA